jgi:hypothetical protein
MGSREQLVLFLRTLHCGLDNKQGVQIEFKKHMISAGGAGKEFRPEENARSWEDWAQKEYLENRNLLAPEIHTPSWLNLSELNEAMTHAEPDNSLHRQYEALRAYFLEGKPSYRYSVWSNRVN